MHQSIVGRLPKSSLILKHPSNSIQYEAIQLDACLLVLNMLVMAYTNVMNVILIFKLHYSKHIPIPETFFSSCPSDGILVPSQVSKTKYSTSRFRGPFGCLRGIIS